MLQKKLQGNFTIADNRIMQNNKLSFEARGLYFYMLSLPNDWEFSEERLAKNGNMGISKIKRILKELFDIGLLKRSFYNDNKGHRKSIYTLFDFDTLENPTLENPTLENPTLENPTLYKELNNTNKNQDKELNIKKEKINKKEKENANALLFNSIWETYPRKVNKSNSYKAFLKAIKKTSYETIKQGIDKYIASLGNTETKYILHLATFLNQERWNDVFTSNNIGIQEYLKDDISQYINKI